MSGFTTDSAETLAEAIQAAIEGQPAAMTETGPLRVYDLPRCYATPMAERAAEALLVSDWIKRHDAEVRAEALREAADAALRMFDPPVSECIEWSEWLRARADNPALVEEGERG